MGECLELVHEEIREIVPRGSRSGGLYELMLDYPLRGGKGLRPALCVATCRSLGGTLEGVLPSAAALELYHNAFLVHDDVEDGSEKRRNEPTLHRLHGVPIAVNVGDGMLALAMQPLLDNVELLGFGRTLRILQTVAHMARESAEGQMLELDWIRRGDWTPSDHGYFRMVYKKSAYYSFLTPATIGAIAAGASRGEIAELRRFAAPLGIAFQIQDDVLNLVGEEARYGKEIGGDLWEGKHTLVLVHALRCAAPAQRARALEILKKPRPPLDDDVECAPQQSRVRTGRDVRFLKHLIDRHGSVEYARDRSREWALRAAHAFGRISESWPESVHREFLAGLVEFVVSRDH